VVRAATKARNDGRVPFAWIVDRSRTSYRVHNWKNMSQLGKAIENELLGYRRDFWQDQPNYVEIWCEKDAMTGSIEPVTREYGVELFPIRGFNSTTKAHEAAMRLLNQREAGKNIVVYYLGDWDPSGENMQGELYERVTSYRRGHRPWAFTYRRVAIHQEDIAKFKLPPLKVKDTDSRTPGFVRRYGNRAVELDALPPSELRRRLAAAIEESISQPEWQRARLVEEAQRETNEHYAETIKEMITLSEKPASAARYEKLLAAIKQVNDELRNARSTQT
jgi:hypothetical protein